MDQSETADRTAQDALFALARGESLASPNTPWAALLDLADDHGLLPLLAASDAAQAMSDACRRALSTRAVLKAARGQAAVRELVRVVAHFRAAGVRLLTWKGPVLADQLYGSPTLRTFSDLDLIVPVGDAPRGEELLRELGYRPNVAFTAAQMHTLRWFHGEQGFVDVEKGQRIDFHWRFGSARFPLPLSFEDAWARHVEWPIGDARLPTLGRCDLVITTATHAAKHLWSKLESLVAVARLGRWRTVNWEEVDALAGALHVRRQVGSSFLLAERLLGAPTPALGRALQAAKPLLPKLLVLVESNLFAGANCPGGGRLRDVLLLADRRCAVLRAAALYPARLLWHLAGRKNRQ